MTKVVGTEIERKRIQYAFWKKKINGLANICRE